MKKFFKVLFWILGFLFTYISPLVLVLYNGWKDGKQKFTMAGTTTIIVGVIVLIYFFGIKKWIKSRKNEERMVKRMNGDFNGFVYLLTNFIDRIMACAIFIPLYYLAKYFETNNASLANYLLYVIILVGVGSLFFMAYYFMACMDFSTED